MPSSTSDSDRPKAARAIVVLLVSLSLYFVVLETVSRTAFPRINHVWRDIAADHRIAVALQPISADQATTILLVGNSYMDMGVIRESLQKEISPLYSVAYLPVWGTNYLDWYFGLRRLFAEGSRPAIVGVCLSAPQLISDATYGETFAHSLMLGGDVLRVQKLAHLDNTIMSNYFFANLSSWLGHRAEIRNWLLRKSIPNVIDLGDYLKGKNSPLPSNSEETATAIPRLRALEDLCKEHGARFFLLIPPTLEGQEIAENLAAVAAKEGISVVLPFRDAELSPAEFLRDGTHLNSRGAVIFTERLGPALLHALYRY